MVLCMIADSKIKEWWRAKGELTEISDPYSLCIGLCTANFIQLYLLSLSPSSLRSHPIPVPCSCLSPQLSIQAEDLVVILIEATDKNIQVPLCYHKQLLSNLVRHYRDCKEKKKKKTTE